MTKRKGIVSKVVLVLVVLTLISGCFVGTTLARYASQGSGSATTGIALWSITMKGDGTSADTPVKFGDLSPSMDDFKSGNRTHSIYTAPKLIATITNNSEVSAAVTIKVSDIEISYVGGGTFESLTDGRPSTISSESYITDNVLKVSFYYGTGSEWSEGYQVINAGGSYETTLASRTGTISVFANVTWVTQDINQSSSVGNTAAADAIDTWIGQNVESLSCTLSYTAVQASEAPADGASA